MPLKLAYEVFGSGPPLVILHGLFGSKDNWRYPARQLADRFQVFTLDQRNHGESPQSEEFDYGIMAEDLLAFLDSLKLARVNLLGHSMGGKTALLFAACHPDRMMRLIVEDMAPGAYAPRHRDIFAALDRLPLIKLASRGEGDRLLRPDIPDPMIRQFLLKNLQPREGIGYGWRFNLPVLKRHYAGLIGALELPGPIEAPTLFIRGSRSDYLPPALPSEWQGLFREVAMATIEDAGHWVHADQPAAFLQTVTNFLTPGKNPSGSAAAKRFFTD